MQVFAVSATNRRDIVAACHIVTERLKGEYSKTPTPRVRHRRDKKHRESKDGDMTGASDSKDDNGNGGVRKNSLDTSLDAQSTTLSPPTSTASAMSPSAMMTSSMSSGTLGTLLSPTAATAISASSTPTAASSSPIPALTVTIAPPSSLTGITSVNDGIGRSGTPPVNGGAATRYLDSPTTTALRAKLGSVPLIPGGGLTGATGTTPPGTSTGIRHADSISPTPGGKPASLADRKAGITDVQGDWAQMELAKRSPNPEQRKGAVWLGSLDVTSSGLSAAEEHQRTVTALRSAESALRRITECHQKLLREWPTHEASVEPGTRTWMRGIIEELTDAMPSSATPSATPSPGGLPHPLLPLVGVGPLAAVSAAHHTRLRSVMSRPAPDDALLSVAGAASGAIAITTTSMPIGTSTANGLGVMSDGPTLRPSWNGSVSSTLSISGTVSRPVTSGGLTLATTVPLSDAHPLAPPSPFHPHGDASHIHLPHLSHMPPPPSMSEASLLSEESNDDHHAHDFVINHPGKDASSHATDQPPRSANGVRPVSGNGGSGSGSGIVHGLIHHNGAAIGGIHHERTSSALPRPVLPNQAGLSPMMIPSGIRPPPPPRSPMPTAPVLSPSGGSITSLTTTPPHIAASRGGTAGIAAYQAT
jgi:hypothetical protein